MPCLLHVVPFTTLMLFSLLPVTMCYFLPGTLSNSTSVLSFAVYLYTAYLAVLPFLCPAECWCFVLSVLSDRSFVVAAVGICEESIVAHQ